MTTDYHEKQYKEKIKKWDWGVMTPEYESLKEEIVKYAKVREELSSAQTWLSSIHDAIERQKESLARLALLKIVTGWKEKITRYFKMLPSQGEFLKRDVLDRETVNKAFKGRSKTLFRIQSKLVALFQEAKETLEMCYINTGEYSPDAEEPSKSRHKYTNRMIWAWFCRDVDKLTQERRSREEEEEKEHKRARIEGGDASLTDDARGVRLVQLLNELKLLL